MSDYKKSGGHEFVLAEKPWWCESTEAIKTRYLICDMLELLYARVREVKHFKPDFMKL